MNRIIQKLGIIIVIVPVFTFIECRNQETNSKEKVNLFDITAVWSIEELACNKEGDEFVPAMIYTINPNPGHQLVAVEITFNLEQTETTVYKSNLNPTILSASDSIYTALFTFGKNEAKYIVGEKSISGPFKYSNKSISQLGGGIVSIFLIPVSETGISIKINDKLIPIEITSKNKNDGENK